MRRSPLEKPLERVLFASRWLMAPIYLGLVVALLALLAKFAQELVRFVPLVLDLKESAVILAVLTLVDLSFVASLLLMIIFSGYESFVSRIDVPEAERPAWMGQIDFSGQKLKLIASIVAISGIHLLKSFMEVQSVDKTNLMWLVITHLVFVLSGVLLALMDYLAARAKAVAKSGG
jgi:uncharacterized protein (TIGR00645 family)